MRDTVIHMTMSPGRERQRNGVTGARTGQEGPLGGMFCQVSVCPMVSGGMDEKKACIRCPPVNSWGRGQTAEPHAHPTPSPSLHIRTLPQLVSLSDSLVQLPLGHQTKLLQGRQQLGASIADKRVRQERGQASAILQKVEGDSDHPHDLGWHSNKKRTHANH